MTHRLAYLFVGALLALPLAASAQSSMDEIELAVLAAPEPLRAEATVISLKADGSGETLREGSNGLMCWESSNYDPRFVAMCTAESNRARVEQNHAFNRSGGSEEQIQARFQEAEENGTRAQSVFGTFYFHLIGESPETARPHTTIAVPYATNESLGLSEERDPQGMWLMQAGTSSAHLMMPRGM